VYGEDETTGRELTETIQQFTFFEYHGDTDQLWYAVGFSDLTNRSDIEERINATRDSANNFLMATIQDEKQTITLYQLYGDPLGNFAQRVEYIRSAYSDEDGRLVQSTVFNKYIRPDSQIIDYTIQVDNSAQYSIFPPELSATSMDDIFAAVEAMLASDDPSSLYTDGMAYYNVRVTDMESYTDAYGNMQQRARMSISVSREESPKPGSDGISINSYILVHTTF